MSSRPIIIVTGANGGVGFGICQRLLFQLCEKNPVDSLPQKFTPPEASINYELPAGCDGLTLIMACRSTKRAEAARTKLLSLLDVHIVKLGRLPAYDGHAHEFRKNLRLEIHALDLAMVSSVFRFANEVSTRYPYISHLICNAGVASFDRIYWPAAIKQLLTDTIGAITAPAFYLQHQGELSVDGLGWVWQCNVFGHYALFRSIEHLLRASNSPFGSRVIWMSSLEASPTFFETDDWQLKRTEHSYESAKYQIDLIGSTLDHAALQELNGNQIRHFVTQPGVCSTNVSAALAGPFLDFFKVILFYIGRMCGSPHHTIVPFKAAIGAVHLSLASLAFLTLSSKGPVKFGAETDRWGAERVGLTEVKEWETQKDEGKVLVNRCESLFQSLKVTEEATVDYEVATEHM